MLRDSRFAIDRGCSVSFAVDAELQHRHDAGDLVSFYGEPQLSASETRVVGGADQDSSEAVYDLQGMTACAAPPNEIWFIQLLFAVLIEHRDDASA